MTKTPQQIAEQFKVHCSAIHEIMHEPKSGTGLSEGTKTYLKKYFVGELYGKKQSFVSKYTKKGKDCEKDSIDFCASALGWGEFVEKNTKTKDNDFLVGTPDLIFPNSIVDIKNSWDCFTFPYFDKEPNKNYIWQLQGYMELFNKETAQVIYVLSDAPPSLVLAAAKRIAWDNDEEEASEELIEQTWLNMRYSHLSPDLLIKQFNLNRDPAKIEAIRQRVIDCRTYLKSLGA